MIVDKSGRVVMVDIKIHKAIEKAIEDIAKLPELEGTPSSQIAAELCAGIKNVANMSNLEGKLKLYVEVHRGERK